METEKKIAELWDKVNPGLNSDDLRNLDSDALCDAVSRFIAEIDFEEDLSPYAAFLCDMMLSNDIDTQIGSFFEEFIHDIMICCESMGFKRIDLKSGNTSEKAPSNPH